MAGITFVKVIDAGPRYTTVLADDGKTYTLKGDRNWRNNNPGNIEYGDFAKSKGAIGSDGRFAVFPSIDQGYAAQETLQFDGKSYRDKSISDAISRYAPAFENNTAAYAAEVAAAAGVPVTTKMSDLTPEQRKAFLAAQHRVEGMKPGTIMGAEGEPVAPEIAEQFSAVRLPPGNVGGKRATVSEYQQQLAQRGFDPGPIDGIRGPRTTAAIKAFQKANGLVEDGIVGPKTMAKLDEQGSYTFDPPPIPTNEEMPPRPTNSWRTFPDPVTEAETRAEQRTLGAPFKPLPAPAPLVAPPYTGKTLGGAPTAPALGSNVPLPRERPTPPGPAPLAAPEAPAAPGGFGNVLGGLAGMIPGGSLLTTAINNTELGKTLGGKVEEAGKTLGNTATTAKTAIEENAPAVIEKAAMQSVEELLKTPGGRGVLLNQVMGITPAKRADERVADRAASAPKGFAYGATGKKLYKIGQTYNSSRGQVVFDGSKFVPAGTQVRSSVDVPPSGLAGRQAAQQADYARRGLNSFGMLS